MAANYPEWVMKHKRKGTYVNKVGDKYYLYAAHSERVKGTNKVRRICDGYLGRITEQDGLIPPKNKLKSSPRVYELGLSYTILTVTPVIREGLSRSFHKYGDCVYSYSILLFIYGKYSEELFRNSYLAVYFPGILFPCRLSLAQTTGIERGERMIRDQMVRVFGGDLPGILSFFPDIRLVSVDGKYCLPQIPSDAAELSEKYSIDWRNGLWQK